MDNGTWEEARVSGAAHTALDARFLRLRWADTGPAGTTTRLRARLLDCETRALGWKVWWEGLLQRAYVAPGDPWDFGAIPIEEVNFMFIGTDLANLTDNHITAYALHPDYRWSGWVVEPSPYVIQELQQLYSGRPVQVIPSAVLAGPPRGTISCPPRWQVMRRFCAAGVGGSLDECAGRGRRSYPTCIWSSQAPQPAPFR